MENCRKLSFNYHQIPTLWKPTKWVCPAKTQISLGIRPVWLESSLTAWRKLGSLATDQAHSEDADQTGWTPRLIWVFAGRTVTSLVLSCHGSYVSMINISGVKRRTIYEYHRVQVNQTTIKEGTIVVMMPNPSMSSILFNPHLPSGPVHHYHLDESIFNIRGVWCSFSFLFCFKKIFLLANSEDPDQTPRSVASDLGLHCLPMLQKWDTRLIWVNGFLVRN